MIEKFNNTLILDLAAGKYNPELTKLYSNNCTTVIHVDRCFKGLNIDSSFANIMTSIMENDLKEGDIFCGCDIFEFLDTFPYKGFDKVISNRFFEHCEYCGGEVGRILEACNNITKSTGTLEIVVPNAKVLAEKLIQCERTGMYTDNDAMILNTEYCNGKFDPHASIWTPVLAYKYINQEATWKIDKIIERFPFAGRDIYMKIFCSKSKELQYEPKLDVK